MFLKTVNTSAKFIISMYWYRFIFWWIWVTCCIDIWILQIHFVYFVCFVCVCVSDFVVSEERWGLHCYIFFTIGNKIWRSHPIFIGGFVCIRLEIFCSISEKSWRQFHVKRYGINPHLSVWIYFFALNFRLMWEVCNGYHNLDLWKNSFDPDIINMLLRTLYIDLRIIAVLDELFTDKHKWIVCPMPSIQCICV